LAAPPRFATTGDRPRPGEVRRPNPDFGSHGKRGPLTSNLARTRPAGSRPFVVTRGCTSSFKERPALRSPRPLSPFEITAPTQGPRARTRPPGPQVAVKRPLSRNAERAITGNRQHRVEGIVEFLVSCHQGASNSSSAQQPGPSRPAILAARGFLGRGLRGSKLIPEAPAVPARAHS